MIKKNSRIYVAGHKGLIGSAIVRNLILNGYKNIITISRNKLDLTNQEKVFKFLKIKKPHFIFIAAAKVGGILANNDFPYQFLVENMQIQKRNKKRKRGKRKIHLLLPRMKNLLKWKRGKQLEIKKFVPLENQRPF